MDNTWLRVRHSYYGDSPDLIRDLQHVLRGDQPRGRGIAIRDQRFDRPTDYPR
jgi:hypothetical protein